MRLRFHGPLGRVTGSCYQLVDEGRNRQILVDCGLLQDEPGAAAWNEGPFPFAPGDIDFVLLTHAHLDHCGLLPKLYRDGYRGEVWCTRETAQAARASLVSAARIGRLPYGDADVTRIRWRHPPGSAPLETTFQLGPDLYARFLRTSHLPGAVAIVVAWGPPHGGQRSIVFSGDLGPRRLPSHGALLADRSPVGAADYVVCESTYGNTVRPRETLEVDQRLTALADVIDPALDKGGTVLLPVFALGRAQDVLFDLTLLFARNPMKYKHFDVVLHSTLANEISQIYAEAFAARQTSRFGELWPPWLSPALGQLFGLNCEELSNPLVADMVRVALIGGAGLSLGYGEPWPDVVKNWRSIHRVVSGRDAPYQADGRPRIVIAAAGMCEGGAIVRYLAHLLEHPNTTVAFTGYQSPSSLGGQIAAVGRLDTCARRQRAGQLAFTWKEKKRTVTRAVPEADVAARIVQLTGYSGHADQADLIDWLAPLQDGQRVPVAPIAFLTHGDDRARAGLVEALAAQVGESLDVECPRPDERWYDLDVGQWLERAPDGDMHGLRMLLRMRNQVIANQAAVLRRLRHAA